MYLKQKGNRCGLYSYYNLAAEMKLSTRRDIRDILTKNKIEVKRSRIYPGKGLYPTELASIISAHLPEGYKALLVSNDWDVFPPNCTRQEVRQVLRRSLRHSSSFRKTHAKRLASAYLSLMERMRWTITSEQITLEMLERLTRRGPVLASCQPALLHLKTRRGLDPLHGSCAIRWDPEGEDSHFFVVARGKRGKFKVIDSSHSANEERCAFQLPKREVHAAITMDDQPTLIQLQHA